VEKVQFSHMHFTENADCKLSVSNGTVIASSYLH